MNSIITLLLVSAAEVSPVAFRLKNIVAGTDAGSLFVMFSGARRLELRQNDIF